MISRTSSVVYSDVDQYVAEFYVLIAPNPPCGGVAYFASVERRRTKKMIASAHREALPCNLSQEVHWLTERLSKHVVVVSSSGFCSRKISCLISLLKHANGPIPREHHVLRRMLLNIALEVLQPTNLWHERHVLHERQCSNSE